MKRFSKKDESGFTLLEVMLVVIIIGIVAVIALPKIIATKTEAEIGSCKSNQQSLETAAEQYKWGEGAYPTGATPAAQLDTLLGSKYVSGSNSKYCPQDGTTALTLTTSADKPVVGCTNHP